MQDARNGVQPLQTTPVEATWETAPPFSFAGMRIRDLKALLADEDDDTLVAAVVMHDNLIWEAGARIEVLSVADAAGVRRQRRVLLVSTDYAVEREA